jgi:hypothetical protein
MKEKSGIPKNPGRHELGMKATMLFPDRDIVEKSYVPIIYTACRTCYSELPPEEIYRRAVAGEIDPAKQRELVNRVLPAMSTDAALRCVWDWWQSDHPTPEGLTA